MGFCIRDYFAECFSLSNLKFEVIDQSESVQVDFLVLDFVPRPTQIICLIFVNIYLLMFQVRWNYETSRNSQFLKKVIFDISRKFRVPVYKSRMKNVVLFYNNLINKKNNRPDNIFKLQENKEKKIENQQICVYLLKIKVLYI